MKTMVVILFALVVSVYAGASPASQEERLVYWDDIEVPAKPAETPELLALGKKVYGARCTLCHGKDGDGESVAAPYLDVKPRDFLPGHFKLRTTPSTTLPAEEDLYRTVTVGFPQYGMPGFPYLSPKERWAVVKYLKTFSRVWKSWKPGKPLKIGEIPPRTEALVEKGRELYNSDKFNCVSCHGESGRGDGYESENLKDAWGNPVLPRAFTSGAWYFKRGNRPQDIVKTLYLGMPGSPMMPFQGKLDDENDLGDLSPEEYEEVLGFLAGLKSEGIMVRPRCAPVYRRVLAQRDPDSILLKSDAGRCMAAKNYCRITPEGNVTPCPYMPASGGNLRESSFGEIWNSSKLFQSLRNPELQGRCGSCEYREVCGGCRARAFALKGDPLSEDPWCLYQPGTDGALAAEPQLEIEWTPEAEGRLKKVPFFVRNVVRSAVEGLASRKNVTTVTPELMDEARRTMGRR